ncbi:MAG TPA: TAXI family TRAP transporter solute-binding subunit [Spirochaetales bacterium]|nr:TAXI family TRAP transporter solute-binding subunit [Spirochaetales bacterium]
MTKKIFVSLLVMVLLGTTGVWAGGAKEQTPAPSTPQPGAATPVLSKTTSPITLKFATMSLGTSMYVYASTITQLVQPELPKGSTIDVQTTGGGVSAPYLIAQGKADLALGNAAPAKWAVEGIVLGRPKAEGVTALVGGMDAPYIAIIFTDKFVKKTGFKSVADIVKAKYPVRVAVKTVGGLGEVACRHVFEINGATYDDIKSWGGSVNHVAPMEIVSMLRDDKADLTIDHIPEGQAAITELSMTTSVHFIGMTPEEQEKLANLGWDKIVMPKGTWKGQETDLLTMSTGIVLLASASLPEDIAYLITKKICENKKTLVDAHAAISVFDPKTAWMPGKVGAPLHPGAVHYFKEMGYMK